MKRNIYKILNVYNIYPCQNANYEGSVSMKKYVIKNFIDFYNRIETFYDKDPTKGTTLFRGVGREDYELIPRIGRIKKFNKFYEDIYGYEEDLFDQFKDQAIPYLDYMPKDDWHWLALAQHYGLPTRLLDWTTNAYVAAYFAIEKYPKRKSVIYILNSTYRLITEESDPFDMDVASVFWPPHISKRISVQQSVFTIQSEVKDPLQPNDFPRREKVKIEKIILDLKDKKSFKESLNHIGVNKAFLFPGLDALTEQLNWEGTDIY